MSTAGAMSIRRTVQRSRGMEEQNGGLTTAGIPGHDDGLRGLSDVGRPVGGLSKWVAAINRTDIDDEIIDDVDAMPQLRHSIEKANRVTTYREAIDWSQILSDENPAEGPLGFVEASWFQRLIGVVILVNVVLIGVEIEAPSPIFWYIEQILLIIFVLEILSRMAHHGWFFLSAEVRLGNMLDALIVGAGVFDSWLMPVTDVLEDVLDPTSGGASKADKYNKKIMKTLVGMLRLLRITRLVRLVKIVPPLYRLATGVLQAMQGMFWVLLLLGMFLYAAAIMLTHLVGKGEGVQERLSSDESVQMHEMFSSVGESMFILFEMMSCWSLMKFQALFTVMPAIRLCFVLFYILTAWALMAVMTGVVSEKMISVHQHLEKQDKMFEEHRRYTAGELLVTMFEAADLDGSGDISREEFNKLLSNADQVKQLMEVSILDIQDFYDLFDWLDHNKDGTISIEEFLEGFRWLDDDVTPKSFVKLQMAVAADLKTCCRRIISTIAGRFKRISTAVKVPLHKLTLITEQIQQLEDIFVEIRAQVKAEPRVQGMTRAGLEMAERRLSQKIDALQAHVDTLANLQAQGLVRMVQPT
eukprot:gnl/TRDRNA2_/TRDRNA2_82030_c0_seq1.p1 gnl/TRDRNA2_/TRDRNA2_82030_c0~~gnl/TRDRNA2_/TRDRNA2_82030_c0_seq1.p1  ORF type:complete len:623 (+),score=119.86 gnl/TRDRNA2_/TRDRNA2_82030_c0_seq1:119-1870(+)